MLVTESTFEQSLEWLKQCNLLSCDTETNWCKFQSDRHLIGIAILGSVDGERKSFYFPYRHRNDMVMFDGDTNLPIELLAPVLGLIQEKKTIWHNAKFDLRQLEQEGFNTEGYFFYDTMLISQYENENKHSHELFQLGPLVGERKLGTEIDELAVALGGGGKNAAEKDAAKTKGWDKIPPSAMAKYAEVDVLIPWKLFKLMWPAVKQEEQDKLYSEQEIQLNHAVRCMEDRGVGTSRLALLEKVEQTEREIQELQDSLGFEPSKPAQLAHRLYALPPEGLGFQPQSYSKRPSKEFAKGMPSMDSNILARLNHPDVEKVLRHRTLSKANDTYYQGWLDQLEPDERIRADFSQTGAVTSRWKCRRPNFHQLPRDDARMPVKSLLRAKPGYELWEFDYSQVEFRLGVIYVKSKFFRDGFISGIDVHKITAQNIGAYNQFPDDPNTARYVGKQANFLIINRGGPVVLQSQLWSNARLDVSIPTCKVFLDKWHDANPEWELFAKQAEAAAKERGFVKLWNGRVRHFNDSNFKSKPRDAFNSLCQGGAAQIMNHSIILLHEAGYELVSQVHDAAWIEIPTDEVEREVPKVIEMMEWPTKDFDFPFTVEAKRLAA